MTQEITDPVLTPDQRLRLDRLRAEMRFDRITVSFSLEDRDAQGRKKSAFYSVTSFLGGEEARPMSFQEVRIAQALLSKHAVETVYGDAVRRGIIGSASAAEEARAILGAYDRRLSKLLTSEGTNGD